MGWVALPAATMAPVEPLFDTVDRVPVLEKAIVTPASIVRATGFGPTRSVPKVYGPPT